MRGGQIDMYISFGWLLFIGGFLWALSYEIDSIGKRQKKE